MQWHPSNAGTILRAVWKCCSILFVKTAIMSDTQENWLCMYQSEAQPLVLLDKWSPPGKMDEHQSLGFSFQSSQSLLDLRNVKFWREIFKEKKFLSKGQLPPQQGGTPVLGVSDRQKWRKQIVETNEMPLCCKSRKRTPCPTACVTCSHFRVLKSWKHFKRCN